MEGISIFRASQVALVVKNLPANAGATGDAVSILESGRSPGGGCGNPLQYSCLENPVDRGGWQAAVHRVAQSQTQLSDFTSLHFKYGLLGGSVVKNLPAHVEDLGSIRGSGRSLRGGNCNRFQYSCLENPVDRGVWPATVHRVTKSWT